VSLSAVPFIELRRIWQIGLADQHTFIGVACETPDPEDELPEPFAAEPPLELLELLEPIAVPATVWATLPAVTWPVSCWQKATAPQRHVVSTKATCFIEGILLAPEHLILFTSVDDCEARHMEPQFVNKTYGYHAHCATIEVSTSDA
jgi:hypothetical protein